MATLLGKGRFWAVLACVATLLWPLAADAATTEYVEGDVIVTFKAGATETTARTSLGRRSLAFTRRFAWLSEKRGRQTGLVQHQTKTTAQLIAELKDDVSIETVEPNYLRWVNGNPDDARFNEMWGLQNTGQTVNKVKGTTGDDIKFPEAWALKRITADQVVVGVLDTGVDYLHPDLMANMWTNGAELLGNNLDDDGDGYTNDYYGYDFIGKSSNPKDSGDHGTHVAGTIAAVGNNQTGIIGVNSDAKVMALKVSSDGISISTASVIEAIQYATMMKTRGVNIVALNASYGGGGLNTSERAAIQAAGSAGIIVCAAAGNDANNNDNSPTYPANYRLPNMIVVAASDQNDVVPYFSNYGVATVDIAAPGTNILSTKPSTLAVKVGSTSYTFAPLTFSDVTPGFSGQVYYCGLGHPADFPAGVSGNIALIQRGTLTFAEKVTNAMAAGARACIIYNNVSGPFEGTLQTAGNWVPAGAVSQADGLAIKAALPAEATTIRIANYQFMDGTSMATPHVTGAVAFAAMNFPNENVAQRIQRILSSVDVKLAFGDKVKTRGRLNLLKMVDANSNGIADWLDKSSPEAPTITTATALPAGGVSLAYSQAMTATGGTAPYTWSIISGVPPPGLTLSNEGILEGIPTAPGTWTFVPQVMDSLNATSGQPVTIDIATTPLAIASPASLTKGRVGVAYAGALISSGGIPAYTWSLTDGALPPGLSLSSAGTLTGTPTVMGTFNFTAQVTDGEGAIVAQSFALTMDPPPLDMITASPIAVGALGTAYAQAITVTGGTGNRLWRIRDGNLPPGLSLSNAGIISGVPALTAMPGTYLFTVEVTDGADSLSKSFQLTVEETPVVITTAAQLAPAVKSVAYKQAFAATGGTTPYTWTHLAGTLPKGMAFSSTGVLSGKPALAGNFNFSIAATDSIGFAVIKNVTLMITASHVKPVVNPIDLGVTRVGMNYSRTVSATNYPKSFTITRLPAGLRYAEATGVISGRPAVSGVFDVQIKATNFGGISDVLTARLEVRAVDPAFVGAFMGIIARDPSANGNLGGRLTLTTTVKGAYTAKITNGASTKSLVGYLADSAPQISGMIGAEPLALTFDGDSHLVYGTHGDAAINGWRSTWTTAHPAATRIGYYTVGIDLADAADQGKSKIPQGSGYASFAVSTRGTLTVTGKMADGTSFTSAGFIGPNGEIPVYQPLYGNLGSLVGTLDLTADVDQTFADNTVSGRLTWLKPATRTRIYPGGFGPINLKVYGKYLAITSAKGIASGLPVSGAANLAFIGGGVEASVTQADVVPFTYTASNAVDLPKPGLIGNPAKVALTINTKTGLIKGAFTLVETSPALTRRVSFRGMVIRPAVGDTKAKGYFLLPQIPIAGQTISTSPILSGKVLIDQPAASE